jgi:hypothetical protein
MRIYNNFLKLPLDVKRLIFTYDSTYYDYFSEKILPFISKKWIIVWTCKFTGKTGIDLTGTNDCKLFNIYNEKNYMYTYNDCSKICKKLNEINQNFSYKPIKE